MRLAIWAVGLGVICATACRCAAALSWDQTRSEAVAPAEQETLQTKFSFKNTGNQAVTIVGINTSCGCTTATLQKRTYEPGESGEIQTTFAFEGRTGKQEKTIQVITDDGRDPTTLVMSITIQEAFTIKPRILIWKLGNNQEPATKSAQLIASRNVPLNPVDIRCDSPIFDVRLVPVTPGQRYELQVTAKSTARPEKTAIRIEIETTPGKRTATVVYAVVQ